MQRCVVVIRGRAMRNGLRVVFPVLVDIVGSGNAIDLSDTKHQQALSVQRTWSHHSTMHDDELRQRCRSVDLACGGEATDYDGDV